MTCTIKSEKHQVRIMVFEIFISNEINIPYQSPIIWEEVEQIIRLVCLTAITDNLPYGGFFGNIILVLEFVFPFYVIGFLIILEQGKKIRCIKQYPVVC